MKKVLLVLGFVFGAIGVINAPAATADDGSRWRDKRDSMRHRGDVQGIKDDLRIDGCETVEKRIENKLEAMKKAAERKKEQYARIKERTQRIIDTAKEKQLDTTKLEEDLVLLDEKVKVFAAEATKLHELLDATKEYSCGESEGQFREALQAAREQMPIVRDAMKDIKQFLRDTLRPDIRELRSKLVELHDENESEHHDSEDHSND